MRGNIRWYSEELEGGFLLGEDGVERYVDSEDVTDSTPPQSGDVVEFEHRDTSEGPRAVDVRTISRSEEADRPLRYGQVTCGACKQTMVPRFVSDSVYPSLGYFACIYCGSIVMRDNPSRSASKPRNTRVRNIILIGVVINTYCCGSDRHCAVSDTRYRNRDPCGTPPTHRGRGDGARELRQGRLGLHELHPLNFPMTRQGMGSGRWAYC